jgi:hypothetical protein
MVLGIQRRGGQRAVVFLVFLIIAALAFQTVELGPFLDLMETVASSTKSTEESSTSSINNTVLRHETTIMTDHTILGVGNDPETNYLQYYVQGGWGNQLRCISSAFFVAWATNRTLILSPVAPHGYLHYRQIFDAKKTPTFVVDFDLKRAYLSSGLLKSYVRLDQVLDIDYSLPMVPTIDYKDFYRNVYPSLKNSTVWVMETNYSHHNTRWIVGQPELKGISQQVEVREHNNNYNNTVVARDLEQVGNTMRNYPIWTLLDSFRAAPSNSLQTSNTTPPIIYQRPPQSEIKPRFSSWIRQTAREILDQNGWNMKTMPYASVHIRGSDGPFKKPEAILQAISNGMDEISTTVQAWASASDYFVSPTSSQKNASTIGLFVATDIKGLGSKSTFVHKTKALERALEIKFNASLVLLFSKDLSLSLVQEIYRNNADTLFPFRNLETPTIFLDQQVAACANIGFAGTRGSTFSDFITTLRNDRINACQ